MSHPTIADRVARIDCVADTYTSVSGADEDIATDLLADLQHWCIAHGIHFDVALRRSQMHVEAEMADEMVWRRKDG